MDASELKFQRLNTKAFIAANPVTIALIPRTAVKTGTGTRYVEGTPREPQELRLIDQTRTYGAEPGTVFTADGQQRKANYQLLGEHDATIGLYDTWVDADGIRFEVGNLLPRNGYEVRAQVVRYGES